MNRTRNIISLSAIVKSAVLLAVLASMLVRCANVMTPQGGPRDTLPPVAAIATPENMQVNFDQKRIFVEFNEYVQLKDQHKEFFTSPKMKTKPTLSVRGRGIQIDIRDTLRENTTYALDFGAAIRDNNEGNILHSFRYVFSTGSEIDSLWMSGYTADAQKADSVGKSYIYYYIADSLPQTEGYDSTLLKRQPDFIGRAETNGIFTTQNLKPTAYRVYAFQDKNDNQMYDAGTDLVGFADSAYNPAEMPEFAIWYDSLRHYWTGEPQLYFRMFLDGTFKRQLLSSSERPKSNQAILRFGARNPRIDSLVLDSIPEDKVIWEYLTEGRDTLALWFNVPPESLPDTIRGRIVYMKHDTTNTLNPATEPLALSWRKIETKEEEAKRRKAEKARAKAEEAGEEYVPEPEPNPFSYRIVTSGEINPEEGVAFEFEYPLVKMDTAAVSLVEHGEDEMLARVPVTMTRDTVNMRRWVMNTEWREGGKYSLYIPAGSLTDVAGYVNDSISKEMTVMSSEKYAKVIVHLKGKSDSAQYILQLVAADGKKVHQQKIGAVTGDYTFNYVPEGEVRLRVVEDMNGNGRWDTGNLVEGRQPERVEFYRNIKDEEAIPTKVNWEVEIDADMNVLFAPVTMESLIKQLDGRESVRLVKYYEEKRKADEERRRQEEKGTRSSGGKAFGGFGI